LLWPFLLLLWRLVTRKTRWLSQEEAKRLLAKFCY
jgi:hypothetical protein